MARGTARNSKRSTDPTPPQASTDSKHLSAPPKPRKPATKSLKDEQRELKEVAARGWDYLKHELARLTRLNVTYDADNRKVTAPPAGNSRDVIAIVRFLENRRDDLRKEQRSLEAGHEQALGDWQAAVEKQKRHQERLAAEQARKANALGPDPEANPFG